MTHNMTLHDITWHHDAYHDITEHTIYENQSWDLYNFLTPLVVDTINRININTTNKRDIIYTSLVNKIGVYFNHKKNESSVIKK